MTSRDARGDGTWHGSGASDGGADAVGAVVEFRDVLADDGTTLRAWTNDPTGRIQGPTVLLCNGLGTNPGAWPALLAPDCDVRVVSWNHRGTGGSERPADPDRVGIDDFVVDALSVMDHFGLDRRDLNIDLGPLGHCSPTNDHATAAGTQESFSSPLTR